MGVTLTMPYAEAVWHDDVVGEHADMHHHTSPLGGHADFLHCPCNHSHLFPHAVATLPVPLEAPQKPAYGYLCGDDNPHLRGHFKPPRA